jgi:hypothetical protein
MAVDVAAMAAEEISVTNCLSSEALAKDGQHYMLIRGFIENPLFTTIAFQYAEVHINLA